MNHSFERSQEIAEKNIEYFTQEEAERLYAENTCLQERLNIVLLENSSQKRVIEKLHNDLEKQDELIRKMNDGCSAKILTSKEIDKLLEVVDDDEQNVTQNTTEEVNFKRLFCIVEDMAKLLKDIAGRVERLERLENAKGSQQ